MSRQFNLSLIFSGSFVNLFPLKFFSNKSIVLQASGNLFISFRDLDTKLDIPYKNDLYIGPHIYYADSDDETNFGLTGNIKKILESEDPKLIPSVEVGVGVLVNDLENNNDDNSSYFLIQLGAGVDRVISDNMSIGVHLYNNYGTDFDDSTNHLTLVAGIQIRLY